MSVSTNKPEAGAVEKADLVTLTIDDVEVSVPKDTLVIRAAEQIGVQVPRFCDHPLLAPVGACRQCLVEVEDAGNGRPIPKPQASCTLAVADGMQVRTQALWEAEMCRRALAPLTWLARQGPRATPSRAAKGRCVRLSPLA